MNNYKKDKSYIKQRLEYKDAVDYIEELEQQIEDLQNENRFLRSHQKLDETFFKWYLEDMLKEKERLNNGIERINSIYRSMQFSAPENQYIFINQLGEVLEELKGSDKDENNRFIK